MYLVSLQRVFSYLICLKFPQGRWILSEIHPRELKATQKVIPYF